MGVWIKRFLMEYLVGERNLARNTQSSYRDTLVLFLPFAGKMVKKAVDRLCIEDISADVIRNFLQYLEKERDCSIVTRNQRLAAIHALSRFIGERSPEHVAWCSEIRSIPFKKATKATMTYLEKPEMNALLNAPDRRSEQGQRDYALMLFLYNTGARADEAAHITIGNLDLGSSSSVKINGKGNKIRYCPLWDLTARILAAQIPGRLPHEIVFLNRRGQPFTRFGINTLVKRNASKASRRLASLRKKKSVPIPFDTQPQSTSCDLASISTQSVPGWGTRPLIPQIFMPKLI